MIESIRLWWRGWRLSSEQSDPALNESTRSVTVAVVQTLSNRAFRRPELSSSDPLESALEQRQFDEETIRTYHNNIRPEIAEIREEYLARGEWSPSIERLVTDPRGLDDLRDLAIGLERLRAGLDAE